MKRIIWLFLILQVCKANLLNAQLKPDWTFYGPQFGFVDGKMTDNQFNITDVTDFKILKDGSFIFTSKRGPIIVLKNGNVKTLPKVLNSTNAVKAGMQIVGARGIAVDKNDNLVFLIENRLFVIEAKYFNGGNFIPSNLGEVPAKRQTAEDGFIYKSISALVSDANGNIWVRGDIADIANTFNRDFNYKNGIARFNGTTWETTDFIPSAGEPASLVVFDEADNAIMQFPAGGKETMLYTHSSQVKSGEKPINSKGLPLDDGGAIAMDYFNSMVYLATSNAIHVQKNGQWEKIQTSPLSNILDIKVDRSGSLWIASNEGVSCVRSNGNQFQLNAQNSILPVSLVRKIAIDSQNKKWFVTDDGLVGYKEPTEPTAGLSVYSKINSGYPDGKIEGIDNFNDGLLLLNSDHGLIRFDGASFKRETPNDLGGMFFNDLAISKDGKAYIGTYRYLHVYDGQGYSKMEWKEDIGKQVTAVVTDDKNTLWIGFDGISKFENGTWQNFNKKNAGLSSNSVYKLFKDSKGNLWGVLSDGIVKYDGTTWTSFTKKTTDIALRNMIGFAETKDGKLWFCNGARLVESDGIMMKEVSGFKSLGSIRNMVSLEDGSLLIATEDKGIAKVKDGNITFLNQMTGLPSNAISRIFKDKDNNIWAAFGFPPPAPSISSTFNRPITPGGAAPPPPPAPSPKEVFMKKIQSSEIQFGLIKLNKF